MTITLHLPNLLDEIVLLSLIAGLLAVYDGVLRLRSSKLIALIEIIVAALVLLSVFFDFGINIPLVILAIILEIVLFVSAVFRGDMRRGTVGISVLALVATTLLLTSVLGWLDIPFLRG